MHWQHFFVIFNAQMEMYGKWQVTHRYSHLKPFYACAGTPEFSSFIKKLFQLCNPECVRSQYRMIMFVPIFTEFTSAFSKSPHINFVMLEIFGSENGWNILYVWNERNMRIRYEWFSIKNFYVEFRTIYFLTCWTNRIVAQSADKDAIYENGYYYYCL